GDRPAPLVHRRGTRRTALEGQAGVGVVVAVEVQGAVEEHRDGRAGGGLVGRAGGVVDRGPGPVHRVTDQQAGRDRGHPGGRVEGQGGGFGGRGPREGVPRGAGRVPPGRCG